MGNMVQALRVVVVWASSDKGAVHTMDEGSQRGHSFPESCGVGHSQVRSLWSKWLTGLRCSAETVADALSNCLYVVFQSSPDSCGEGNVHSNVDGPATSSLEAVA